jgi:site-specific recombinase XerD/predicted RNA-binding Zn-ribbon protein involved in translation (DUF1610 family)
MATQATTKGERTSMAFDSLKQTHEKLQKNPELSEHNKEVLNEFFRKMRSQAVGSPTIRDYASRFNGLAPHIDFKLDEPDKKDLEGIIAALNQDEIRKNNGEKYSDYSKEKYWSTISRFYNGFIKKKDKGYNPEIDGEALIEDLEVKTDLSVNIDSDRKPDPLEVRKVAQEADNLRDKAIILFGWATGHRVGEVYHTQHDSDILTWSDLKFTDEELWVTLNGKTGEREVPVKTSMPVMRELWENSDADLDDPVFKKQTSTSVCPECRQKVKMKGSHCAEKKRKYECNNCGWQGGFKEIEKKREALTDNAVRKLLRKYVEKAGLKGQIDDNPHDFFRKSRAIYKASIEWTEYQLRAFFGWSENSDAPKHYITLVKEDLRKALRREYGEEIEESAGMNEEALRPVKCANCGKVNSATWDLCKECNYELSEQGTALSKPSMERAEEMEETLVDMAKEVGMEEQGFRQIVRERKEN